MTKKRIIYIGNFSVPFSTENDIMKSFEGLGWEVYAIQENKMTPETIKEIKQIQGDFDFILYTRTWADWGKIWADIIKNAVIPTVSVHLDLYLGLSRGDNLKSDTFFWSDYVFSADGGEEHGKQFKKLGFNHHFLPPAILEDSCYLGEKKKEFSHDVIFVGSFNYHAEWKHRRLLIKWLKNTYQDRFKLYPNEQTPIVRGKDLNDLYNSAKVVVGDSTYSPNYWSDRIPETLGRGGFLLHPFVDELDKQFEYYKDLIPYKHGDFTNLKQIIDYYIKHDKERDEIRLQGMASVKSHSTYRHRAEYIINFLGL